MCEPTPTIFVNNPKSRSLPTTVAGGMPRNRSTGAISAPLPTPVRPIMKPTIRPARTRLNSVSVTTRSRSASASWPT
jgi:hypothetical protein